MRELPALSERPLRPLRSNHRYGCAACLLAWRTDRGVIAGRHVLLRGCRLCCRRCQSGRSDLCDQITGTAAPRVFWHGEPIVVLLQAGTFCSAVVVSAAGAVRAAAPTFAIKSPVRLRRVSSGMANRSWCYCRQARFAPRLSSLLRAQCLFAAIFRLTRQPCSGARSQQVSAPHYLQQRYSPAIPSPCSESAAWG